MPKNSSARRRRRARRIEAEGGVKYIEALRRGEELAAQAREQAERNSRLRPSKIEIDGVEKYWRHEDAEQLGQDGMADPTNADVVAAADVLLPKIRVLRSAKLKPTTVVVPYWQRDRLTQNELNEEVRTKLREVLDDLKRVREDADIGRIEWTTVAAAYYGVRVKLNGLDRITAGPLHDQLESAIDAADVLSMTAEAVHSRGCLLGADSSRRFGFGWGYAPCDGGEVRVRVRIFDDDTIVTVPGCPRHAAEEIAYCDFDVEEGLARVEVMGGTTADLDMIYDLAEQVRRERDQLQRVQEKNKSGVRNVPVPPWRNGQDHW